jgi:PAS domain S-box-containing protein
MSREREHGDGGANGKLLSMRDHVRAMHERIARLRDRAQSGSSNAALEEAFEELEVTREALTVADEELARAARALEEANQRAEGMLRHYRELFDGAPDGYAITDPHGVIRQGNRTLAVMLGVHPQFLERRPLVNFVVRGDVRSFRSVLARLAESRSPESGHEAVETFSLGMRPRHKEPVFVAEIVAKAVRGVRDHLVSIRWSVRRKAATNESRLIE